MVPGSLTPGKVPQLVAAALVIVAFLHARSLTRDLVWPALDVQYREMAAAQTVLDGHPADDPAYRGESRWYNPMSGWILAAAARLTPLPLPLLTVRIGPVINLLAPLAFYLLASAWLAPWAAVASLAAFLFLSALGLPFTDAATYSPWFAPENYGQGLFYLALLVAHRAVGERPVAGGAVIEGVVLGLIFLVHTAPALVLGTVLVALFGLDVASTRRLKPALVRFATILGTALVVAAPVAVIVLGRYHAHVVNPFPATSPNPIFGSLSTLVLKLAVSTPLLIAIAAIGIRLARNASGLPRVLVGWILATAGTFAWVAFDVRAVRTGYATLPRLPVPGFHFVCYALALASLGFGIAVGDLSAWAAARLQAMRRPVSEGTIATTLIGLTLAASLGPYLRRPDATELLREARTLQSAFPAGLYAWARGSTAPDDVFLCTDAEALFVISPAGRKVVATNRYFSNPFVDWVHRDADRNAMYDALARGDAAAFAPMASAYDVHWIVVPNGLNDDLRRLAGIPRAKVPTVSADAVAGLREATRAWGDERYTVFAYRTSNGGGLETPHPGSGGSGILPTPN